MKNLIIVIIVIIVILIIFAHLSSVRFGFPNSRNPEVTKSWISGSQGYGPNYDLFDENVECYCSHDCFWVCKPRLLVGTIYVTAVERNGNGIIINDMNKEIERRWL